MKTRSGRKRIHAACSDFEMSHRANTTSLFTFLKANFRSMQLPADLSNERVDRQLIESLKKKVDFCIRSDAGRALELADLAVDLSLQIDDPFALAVALRSKASA